jgi:hypothetical protein
LVARQLNNRELLKLSMCCRATRDAVDSSAERLSQGLYVANWNSTGANLKVREYPNEIILHIDCDLIHSLRHKIMTSVTGQVGEVLEMGISVKGMHTDDTFTQTLPLTRLRYWKSIMLHTEYNIHPNAKYGRYTLTLKCIEPHQVSNKSIFLVLENIELLTTPLKRRCLMALKLQTLCMLCESRYVTYCAIDCPEPLLRKICKRCANETMVTERSLVRDWMVSKYDITILRHEAIRYYSMSGTHFITWIPKCIVRRHFGAATWAQFMRNAGKRRRERLESNPHTILNSPFPV